LLDIVSATGATAYNLARVIIDLAFMAAMAPILIELAGMGIAGGPTSEGVAALALCPVLWLALVRRRKEFALGELERGAFRLLSHESNLLDIALECGFQNYETFLRAFRRRFGKSPSDYREWVRAQVPSWGEQGQEALVDRERHFEISATKVVRLRPMHLAFRRHVGPYESVPESIFDELEEWAARHQLPGPPVWLGIGHDAPGATPPDKLRFDAALVVPGPFDQNGLIGYQLLPGGTHAVTTHAGPYETLGAAYARIFPRLSPFRDYETLGLPAVEVYHAARVNVRFALNHTDLCLPMRRKTPAG
jgi:AraC family transcriptional regulator